MSYSKKVAHPARIAEPFRVCVACVARLQTTEFEVVSKNTLSVICDACVKHRGGYYAWRKKHLAAARHCKICGDQKLPSEFYGCNKSTCRKCFQRKCAESSRRKVERLGEDNQTHLTCSECSAVKPIDSFYKRPAGRHGRASACRECFAGYAKKGKSRWIAKDTDSLLCVGCNVTQPASCFRKARRNRGGRETMCVECSRVYGRNKMNEAYARNPAKFIERANMRRAQKASGDGVSAETWAEILEYFDNRCAYCLRKAVDLTVDHVIAMQIGGEHAEHNVVPACGSCNSSKGDRLLPLILDKQLIVGERMFARGAA